MKSLSLFQEDLYKSSWKKIIPAASTFFQGQHTKRDHFPKTKALPLEGSGNIHEAAGPRVAPYGKKI